LILVPFLWTVIGFVCWELRATDRLMTPLSLTAAVLCLANTAMLYSQAAQDGVAMVAHLGRGIGYFILLLSLMKVASLDIAERIRAEAKLARLNEELERRVQERTGELQAANETLQGEIAVRRQVEQRVLKLRGPQQSNR
jgi:C4-dicarboxylate-specific signal transduction histidine kinase